MLVKSVVDSQRESVESSGTVAAPGGTEPETGTHRSDATGGGARSMGSSLDLSMSGGRTESTSFIGQGLTAITNSRVTGRSMTVAASMDPIVSRGRTLDASGQSSTPPPPNAASRWWESLVSGSTLIPRAFLDAGDRGGSGILKGMPKAPVFDGTEVSYPSWSKTFC